MSFAGQLASANPPPPVAPKAASALPENWLALLGDAGPAARLLSVLEKLETSQANLTAADGGKAGLIRKTQALLAGEAPADMQAELAALRQENDQLRTLQQAAADRLARLIPSLAAHLHEETVTSDALAECTAPQEIAA